jgi:carbonic anhydrase
LNPLIRRLKDESVNEHKKKYFSFDLSELIPLRVHNYYRYMGSLTTPNCMEGINWFLTADPILPISRKQISIFQNLKTHHNTYVCVLDN